MMARHPTCRRPGVKMVGMSSRADLERIHAARRAATVERLVREGRPRDRVETLVARWEAMAAADGRPHDRAFWEAFEAWRTSRRNSFRITESVSCGATVSAGSGSR